MSKISIKKDFKDGEKLFASELNNNFGVIEAGVNANEANLEAIIEDAETRLQKELENITADRGWDWGGSSTDRVTFYKGDTAQVDSQAIKNGQMLYNTETGETALDDNGKRIVTGSGNVVYIGDEEPTNEATKIWINSDSIEAKGNQVTNSMEGNETNIAPSVNAVKEYIDNFQEYSEEEQVVGTWLGKPLYRKTLEFTPNASETKSLNINNIDKVWIDESHSFIDNSGETLPLNQYITEGYSRAWINKETGLRFVTTLNISNREGYLTVLYTKTTD